MKRIIAFTGVKESGKSTSFQIIKEVRPDVVEVTLADKLKNACAKAFGIERNWFDDQKLKEKDLPTPIYLTADNVSALLKEYPDYNWNFDRHVRPHIGEVMYTARRIAQYAGTEILRAVNDDIHCLEATKNLPDDGIFVVTDMRFPNEFGFFQKSHSETFYPIYVSNFAAESKLGPNPHASEKYVLELAKKCEKIDNNGTLQELRERVLSKFQDIITRNAMKRSS